MMYVFAVLAGCLVVLSMVMNSRISRSIGVFQGTFSNYAVGLLTSILVILVCLATGADFGGAGATLPPWYVYCGGLIGVVIVASCNVVIPRIPVVYSAVLIFLGQIVTGLVVDALVSGVFDRYKALGAALVTCGLVVNAWIDARSPDEEGEPCEPAPRALPAAKGGA
jgi:uncharacterized membrane protein YdcZ (DUF606 family)